MLRPTNPKRFRGTINSMTEDELQMHLSQLTGIQIASSEAFLTGIQQRLDSRYGSSKYVVEPHQVVATAKLLRRQIDQGQWSEPQSGEGWQTQLAIVIALVKRLGDDDPNDTRVAVC